jgi:hypothetical protein
MSELDRANVLLSERAAINRAIDELPDVMEFRRFATEQDRHDLLRIWTGYLLRNEAELRSLGIDLDDDTPPASQAAQQ